MSRSPRIASTLAALLGVVTLASVAGPHGVRSLAVDVAPLPVQGFATATVLVVALLFLRISSGLRRRKHAEWRIALVATAGMAVADGLRFGRRPVDLVLTLVLLAVLAAGRHEFRGGADPRTRWFGAAVAVQALLAGSAIGLAMLYLPGHVAPAVPFTARAGEVLDSLVGLGGSIPIADDRYGDVFHLLLLMLGLGGVAVGALLAFRPPRPVPRLEPWDETRLRHLLARHGHHDSLGYFALRDDKSVVWSDSGKAAITYRVVNGVALVSGDPIGDPEAWPGAMAAYARLVGANGWTPAALGTSELGARVFRRECALRALSLGDEAVVDTAVFGLDGRAMRGVRQACHRAARLGYQTLVRRVGDIPAEELLELQKAAAAWRGDDIERGYSMALSRLGDARDPDCVVVTAHRGGTLCGLLHFVPWGPDGWSLDLMRRDPAADNGVNELMIVSAIGAGRRTGIARVSLNFAVFRDALERGDRIGATPVARTWRRLLVIASRWWQIDSLYRFNEKFRPTWQPRFVCYGAARDLPRIALAALEAEAFVVRPRLRALHRVA